MQNFSHLAQNLRLLWQKKPNLAVIDPFFNFSSPKITLAVKLKSWNLAQIYPYHIGTCMQNFRQKAWSLWPWRYKISQEVQKSKILDFFFFNFKVFFCLFGLVDPPESLGISWYTYWQQIPQVGTIKSNVFPDLALSEDQA